ncbi:MAG TPA: F0F1 ATP synthase subunit delta [Cryptosporangiaceae bacterium]|nr:F0F1 ATP synthase subunit delta [Cryptosporangiaceae bacterium]
MLRTVVTARWSRPVDLVEAVELLAVDAELAEAEATGTLAEVEEELFRFAQIVADNPRLGVVLNDPTADADRRAGLVRDLLSDRAQPVTVRLATFAVQGLGGRNVDASLQRLVERAAARRDRQIAYVTVAAPMTHEQQEHLSDRLSALYGQEISLKVGVDPDVLGGARVRIGDDLYDGSVARRLDQARAALAR